MPSLSPQHFSVSSEYDLIALRQAVRQQARVAGLAPPQQARITAAISEVARVLLHSLSEANFIIRLAEEAGAPLALEVACGTSVGHGSMISRLYNSPDLSTARDLVDDARLISAERGPLLALRMRVGR
jgi:hypothetical protein